MIKIKVIKNSQEYVLEANPGDNLLHVLRQDPELDLAPHAPCGGRGKCGVCRVIINKSDNSDINLPKVHEDEINTISGEDLNSGVRLSCRVPVLDGMTVRLEEAAESRIETRTDGLDALKIDPVMTKKTVIVPEGSIEDQRPYSERLEDEFNLERGSLPYEITKELPSIPDGKTPVTIIFENGRPAAVDLGDTSSVLYAAAVDIGTTTVAMYLLDLVSGKIIGRKADLNRQSPYGADVITRLEYARSGEKERKELQNVIALQLEDLLKSLTDKYGVETKDVHIMAVAGNTAMLHLLCGWNPKGLGEAPFLPAVLKTPSFAAEEIGITAFSRLKIWPLPSLSAYVGADITGGIVASGMFNRDGYDLILDIGTNGEMAIGGANGITCCSTAAGPAFEGAHLSSGLGSVPGAVDHVDVEDGRMIFSTIENAPAAGFCGSGVIDLTAYFVTAGLIDDTGRMVEEISEEDSGEDSRYAGLEIEKGDMGSEFYWKTARTNGKKLGFTQKDLREVQMAKAAIEAGVKTLMDYSGIGVDQIDTLWLAGGFGSYIRPESAAAIGLIPPELVEKTKSLGNAAAQGAIMCLLSKEKYKEAAEIAEKAETIELSGRPDFQNNYIDAMMFSSGVMV